jgi:hypothetical protein
MLFILDFARYSFFLFDDCAIQNALYVKIYFICNRQALLLESLDENVVAINAKANFIAGQLQEFQESQDEKLEIVMRLLTGHAVNHQTSVAAECLNIPFLLNSLLLTS